MNAVEWIVDSYVNTYGTETEKEVHELYRGDYEEIFANPSSNLEEAAGFAGVGTVLFSVLMFVLECVGASLVQESVDSVKKTILGRLKKGKEKIVTKSPTESTELTREVVEKMIVLLQQQLNDMEQTK